MLWTGIKSSSKIILYGNSSVKLKSMKMRPLFYECAVTFMWFFKYTVKWYCRDGEINSSVSFLAFVSFIYITILVWHPCMTPSLYDKCITRIDYNAATLSMVIFIQHYETEQQNMDTPKISRLSLERFLTGENKICLDTSKQTQ